MFAYYACLLFYSNCRSIVFCFVRNSVRGSCTNGKKASNIIRTYMAFSHQNCGMGNLCYYLSVAMVMFASTEVSGFFLFGKVVSLGFFLFLFFWLSRSLSFSFRRYMTWNTKTQTMIYSIYSKSPFGYLVSIIYCYSLSHRFCP